MSGPAPTDTADPPPLERPRFCGRCGGFEPFTRTAPIGVRVCDGCFAWELPGAYRIAAPIWGSLAGASTLILTPALLALAGIRAPTLGYALTLTLVVIVVTAVLFARAERRIRERLAFAAPQVLATSPGGTIACDVQLLPPAAKVSAFAPLEPAVLVLAPAGILVYGPRARIVAPWAEARIERLGRFEWSWRRLVVREAAVALIRPGLFAFERAGMVKRGALMDALDAHG